MQTIQVYSEVLKKEVDIRWSESKPDIVMFDGAVYNAKELKGLEGVGGENLRGVHNMKTLFEGTAYTKDKPVEKGE